MERVGRPTIRALAAADWPACAAIYADGIATGAATFEEAVPDWPTWSATHLATPRLVAERTGAVLGWAALARVSSRPAYGGVAEVSVYVAAAERGRGCGRQLLAALVADADETGIWTLQAGIFPENRASLALHAACGFRTVGTRERIGRLAGRWRDVVLMERRSPRT